MVCLLRYPDCCQNFEFTLTERAATQVQLNRTHVFALLSDNRSQIELKAKSFAFKALCTLC